jgi:hypothetical protein
MRRIPVWKRAGRSDDWIANYIGISLGTLKNWKKDHKEFSAMFKRGRAELQEELEESLYKRALGYDDIEEEYAIDDKGNVVDGVIKIKKKKKYSETALKMALANLDKKKWSKKALSGDEDDDEKSDKVIFGGDDDL